MIKERLLILLTRNKINYDSGPSGDTINDDSGPSGTTDLGLTVKPIKTLIKDFQLCFRQKTLEIGSLALFSRPGAVRVANLPYFKIC